jgi:hypothetical protein
MVFKKRRKLKALARWRMNGQNTEGADKCNYLGVTLGSTGGLNKQKALAKMDIEHL